MGTQSTPALHRYLSALFHAAESEGLQRIQAQPGPAVTFSRETGAGATSIARRLVSFLEARRAGKPRPWAVFDKELTVKAMEDHGLPEKLAEFIPEKEVREIRGFVGELFGLHPSLWTLVQKTNETIERLARSGNVILIGRGSNIITAGMKNVWHIRLVRPYEERLRQVESFYEMERGEAIRFIKDQDASRRRYLKQCFDRDIEDAHLYHLVINTSAFSEGDVVRMIGEFILASPPQS